MHQICLLFFNVLILVVVELVVVELVVFDIFFVVRVWILGKKVVLGEVVSFIIKKEENIDFIMLI